MIEDDWLQDYEENDKESIKICILNLIEYAADPIDLEEALKKLSEISHEKISTLKKYYKEEKIKTQTIKKTTSKEIIPFFANKIQLAENYHEIQPYFYDKNKLWWFWNKEKSKYELTDETDLLIQINKSSPYNTVKSTEKVEIIEALKQVGRTKIPAEPKKEWLQFGDIIYDINTDHEFEATPEYLFTNPIPWTPGTKEDTPTIDKLFREWVGESNEEQLYELIAYCCYRAYPIQLLFCLWGNGRNGKTQYMKILNKFIGQTNITSSELDTLTENRFESFKLYKKLVCTIGETNFGVLSKSSLIKKLVGGDMIGFEKKNKDPFDDYNYAKIIISSNSLPSTQDTSDGFYRRWLIIDFPNEFAETGKEVWEQVPDEEYYALSAKVKGILKDLLVKGVFSNQGSINDRKAKFISVSNPLSLFIKEFCVADEEEMILYNQLYTEYLKYLAFHKRRRVKMKEFKAALEDEGFYVEKGSKKTGLDDIGNPVYKSGYYVMGLALGKNGQFGHTTISTPRIRDERVTQSKLSKLSDEMNLQIYPITHFSCSVCGEETETNRLFENKVYCPLCLENKLKQAED